MTWVDGVILGVVALSALFSMVRGFVREMLGLGAWIGALLACLQFNAPLQPYIASLLPPGLKHFAVYGAMGVVFLVALIVLSLVVSLIAGLVRASPLSGLDHSLGILFGLARGAVIVVLAYIALGMAEPANAWPAPVAQARLLPLAYDGAKWLTSFLPPPYQPKVQPLPGTQPAGAESGPAPVPDGKTL